MRVIICQNGQYFFVDEARYLNGHYLLSFLSSGEYKQALTHFVTNYAHTFFTFFASIAEIIRYIFLEFKTYGQIEPYQLNLSEQGLDISAFVLSLSSVINIYLVYKIILNLGGNYQVGIIASILMSICSVNTYYSRHLLPYDSSLMLFLLALLVSIQSRYRCCFCMLAGILAALGVLTYNGYWFLSLVVLLINILMNHNIKERFLSGFFCMVGGGIPIILLQFISWKLNLDFITGIIEWLSATAKNQYGDLGSGLYTLIEYLWHSESIVFIILSSLTIYSLRYLKLVSKKINYLNFGILITTLILSKFMLFSDILEFSVLYGRTIKQIIPFLCISAAYPIYIFFIKLSIQWNNITRSTFLLIIVLIFYLNHLNYITLVYPRDVKKMEILHLKEFSEIAEIKGPNVEKLEVVKSSTSLRLVNAQVLVPPIEKRIKIDFNKLIYSTNHPYTYKPYQFVHYNRFERSIINKNILKIKILH